MAYTRIQLNQAIDEIVTANANNEITGTLMNQLLKLIVNASFGPIELPTEQPVGAGDYVTYNNDLYYVLSNTLAGENPTNTPAKFKKVSGAGVPSMEQTRAQGNALAGNINMANNRMLNLPYPTSGGEPATLAFLQEYLLSIVQLKGALDGALEPDYPAAQVGHAWLMTNPGKIGGAAGKDVLKFDIALCIADNAGGDEAAVGSSWIMLSQNQGGSGPATTDELPEGATNKYFTETRVRATPLTGYSVGGNTAISASDTMLGALAKLQGQMNQRATIAQLNAAVTGLLDYRGDWDATIGEFPPDGSSGSGTGGAVLKADAWFIQAGTSGTLDGVDVSAGDLIIAKIDSPGNNAANWQFLPKALAAAPPPAGETTVYYGDLIQEDDTNNFTCSISGIDSYSKEAIYVLTFDTIAENEGVVTIEINTLGQLELRGAKNETLAINDLASGQRIICVYDSNTNCLLHLTNEPKMFRVVTKIQLQDLIEDKKLQPGCIYEVNDISDDFFDLGEPLRMWFWAANKEFLSDTCYCIGKGKAIAFVGVVAKPKRFYEYNETLTQDQLQWIWDNGIPDYFLESNLLIKAKWEGDVVEMRLSTLLGSYTYLNAFNDLYSQKLQTEIRLKLDSTPGTIIEKPRLLKRSAKFDPQVTNGVVFNLNDGEREYFNEMGYRGRDIVNCYIRRIGATTPLGTGTFEINPVGARFSIDVSLLGADGKTHKMIQEDITAFAGGNTISEFEFYEEVGLAHYGGELTGDGDIEVTIFYYYI